MYQQGLAIARGRRSTLCMATTRGHVSVLLVGSQILKEQGGVLLILECKSTLEKENSKCI